MKTLSGAARRRKRGYLLLECMIAGSILAVTLSIVYGSLAKSRVDITKTAHRDSATALAAGKLAALECDNGTRTDSGGFQAFPGAELNGFINYTGFWRMSAAGVQANTNIPAGAGGGTIATDLWLIEAVVSYPVRHASLDDMRDGLADGLGTVRLQRIVN